MKLITEDGIEVEWEVPFWIVCVKNHECNIGTKNELILYKPYKATVHTGAGMNTFGLKLFSTEELANEWCGINKQ